MSEIQVALAHHKAGRLQQAKRAYETLLAKEPGHIDALHHLALIHVEEGDLARGIALLRETVAAQPRFPIAWFNLGLALGRAGEFSDAVAALHDVGQPAVLALISRVCRFGAEAGIEVSLCGDAGGDPAHIEDLLKAGLRTLSVAPAVLARAKMAIAEADTGTGDA